MKTPSYVREVLTDLAADRHATQSRLDAIDVATENLKRLWGQDDAPIAARHRAQNADRRTVARTPKVTNTAAAPALTASAGDQGDAAARRELLMNAILKSEFGLTGGELAARFPKMTGQDRRNALQTLKEKGKIRRAGNAWVAAA